METQGILLVLVALVLAYIGYNSLGRIGELPSKSGPVGLAVIVIILAGWWWYSGGEDDETPGPAEDRSGVYLIKLTVRTDRFSCIQIPWGERVVFRIEEDAEELTLIRWYFQDGHIETGLDYPGGTENDKNTSPAGAAFKACYLSIDPEGDGYIIERIGWFECGDEGEPPCARSER